MRISLTGCSRSCWRASIDAARKRLFSQSKRDEVFRIAKRAMPKCYADEIAIGMTDIALTSALEQVLGIFGGSCRLGRLNVTHLQD